MSFSKIVLSIQRPGMPPRKVASFPPETPSDPISDIDQCKLTIRHIADGIEAFATLGPYHGPADDEIRAWSDSIGANN